MSKIVGDAGVDVGIGAVSLAAGGMATALVVGSLGAPVLVGAVAGVIGAGVVSSISNLEIKGKSVSNHIKDGIQSGVKTIAGWFK